MAETKEAGREHKVEDAAEAVKKAAEKVNYSDVPDTDFGIGEQAWMKVQIVSGADGILTAAPFILGKLPNKAKLAHKGVFAGKATLEREVPAADAEPVVEYVAPEKSKVRQAFEEQYRALWEMDSNASANGSRDGSDSAGVQITMSELQKLSKRLKLGIKFNELDAPKHSRRKSSGFGGGGHSGRLPFPCENAEGEEEPSD